LAYNIVFKKSVKKDLKQISIENAARIFQQIETVLSTMPLKFPFLKGALREFRKFRVGDYRVVYKVIEQDVVIHRIRHRRSVYD